MTERLQTALAKARREREDGAPRPRFAGLGGAAARDAAWDALPRVQVDRAALRRNRILAVEPGPEATPFDILRTRVLQRMKENGWRRLAVTSPSPRCGKSTLLLNLAFSLARTRETRILGIETDMRRPSQEAMLGLPSGGRAVAPVLEGTAPFADSAVRPSDTLALALASAPRRNPSDILLGPSVGPVLAEIEVEYGPDILLFDMPPLLVSDDTQAFLEHVDCALIVAAAEATTVQEVDRCERLIAQTTGVMGVVLNKCRHGTGEYGATYH